MSSRQFDDRLKKKIHSHANITEKQHFLLVQEIFIVFLRYKIMSSFLKILKTT